MAKARNGAKTADKPRPILSNKDPLVYLARALRPQDADIMDILAKLRSLNDTLDRQEAALSEWPESTSKACVSDAIMMARSLASKIAADFGGTTGARALARRAKSK